MWRNSVSLYCNRNEKQYKLTHMKTTFYITYFNQEGFAVINTNYIQYTDEKCDTQRAKNLATLEAETATQETGIPHFVSVIEEF